MQNEFSVVCALLLHSFGSALGIDKLSTSHCNLETLPQRAALSYNISLRPPLSPPPPTPAHSSSTHSIALSPVRFCLTLVRPFRKGKPAGVICDHACLTSVCHDPPFNFDPLSSASPHCQNRHVWKRSDSKCIIRSPAGWYFPNLILILMCICHCYFWPQRGKDKPFPWSSTSQVFQFFLIPPPSILLPYQFFVSQPHCHNRTIVTLTPCHADGRKCKRFFLVWQIFNDLLTQVWWHFEFHFYHFLLHHLGTVWKKKKKDVPATSDEKLARIKDPWFFVPSFLLFLREEDNSTSFSAFFISPPNWSWTI